jgi:hypothetical protein
MWCNNKSNWTALNVINVNISKIKETSAEPAKVATPEAEDKVDDEEDDVDIDNI